MLIKWADTQNRIERLLFNSVISIRHFGMMRVPFSMHSRLETKVEQTALSCVGLILVAVVMRLASLNIPLIHDEAYTYKAFASVPLWQTISDYHLPNNHVLLSIIINILTHLFGNRLWLIRLPTIIAGVLMVPAGYVLGKRLYSREAGILGAALDCHISCPCYVFRAGTRICVLKPVRHIDPYIGRPGKGK